MIRSAARAAGGRPRILVVCTRYIGDTVLAIPFLRNLRRGFPDAVIDVLTDGAARVVLADCPYVDELLVGEPAAGRGLAAACAGLWAHATRLRRRRYDRTFLLKRSVSTVLPTVLAGIPLRTGLSGESRPFLTRAVPFVVGRHQADLYLDLLRGEGIGVDDGHAENWAPAAAVARVSSFIDRLPAGRPRVFIAPKSTCRKKHWSDDRWADLMTRLVTGRGCELMLCGGPADEAAHRRILSLLDPAVLRHVHDRSREVPLRDLGALVSRMELCVGVDTGLVHVAASFGLPVVALFGPTDPNRWAPLSSRSEVLRSPEVRRTWRERMQVAAGVGRHLRWPLGKAALSAITVDAAFAAASRLLADACRPPRVVEVGTTVHRYAVIEGRVTVGEAVASPAADVTERAAAVPATKPLAQAH